jgi:hypothetical protein
MLVQLMHLFRGLFLPKKCNVLYNSVFELYFGELNLYLLLQKTHATYGNSFWVANFLQTNVLFKV